MRPVIQYLWLSSLLFTVSTAALLSSTPSSHPISTTKKSVAPTSSSHHTTSTTKKTVSSTHSSSYISTITPKHILSSKPTPSTSSPPSKTTTSASPSTPALFYLLTAKHRPSGIYLHSASSPGLPAIPLHGPRFPKAKDSHVASSPTARFNTTARPALSSPTAIRKTRRWCSSIRSMLEVMARTSSVVRLVGER